jgi:hypothetical protein
MFGQEDDGFGPLAFCDMQSMSLDFCSASVKPHVSKGVRRGRKQRRILLIHRKPPDATPALAYLFSKLGILNMPPLRMLSVCSYFVLLVFGKRNIPKEPVEHSRLTRLEKEVFFKIRGGLIDETRKQRVFDFMRARGVTKRLINYFVVHYILVEKDVSYYLDLRQPCGRIIGEIGNPFQPEIVELISKGANIVWINLHQEYKASKNRDGQRNLHTPYARSTSVYDQISGGYSLCELNFYIWLERVGGFDAFARLEPLVRSEKVRYDLDKRNSDKIAKPDRKRRKVVLKETEGLNYRNFLLRAALPAPFSPFPVSGNTLKN